MDSALLTRKLGPLKTWEWGAIVSVGAGAYYLYEAHKANSAASTAGASTATVTSGSVIPETVVQVQPVSSPTPVEVPPPTHGHAHHPRVPGKGGTMRGKPIIHRPKHGGHTVRYGPVRRTATGDQSLADIAKSRHTTVAHLIATTKSAHQITPAHLKRFLAAAAHPNRKLPKGLVYYTSH